MKRTNGEILKFAIVGFANFLIIMATAWLLGEKLALHYMIANVCAYLLAFVNNFYWNRTWVFQSTSKKIRRQIVLFLTAYGCAYLVKASVVYALVEGIGTNEPLAQFIGLFPFGAVNFLMNKLLTFRT